MQRQGQSDYNPSCCAGVSDEVKSKDDIHKQIQFLSVADTQTSFIERFMSQVGRIGAQHQAMLPPGTFCAVQLTSQFTCLHNHALCARAS